MPCKGEDNCGEAVGFKNEKDFTDFVEKYNPVPPPSVKFTKIPQIVPETNVIQPMAFRSAGVSMMAA